MQAEASTTVRIVRFHEVGGPEALKLDEVLLPEPSPGEVRLRVNAIGLNRAELVEQRFPSGRNGRFLHPRLSSQPYPCYSSTHARAECLSGRSVWA